MKRIFTTATRVFRLFADVFELNAIYRLTLLSKSTKYISSIPFEDFLIAHLKLSRGGGTAAWMQIQKEGVVQSSDS